MLFFSVIMTFSGLHSVVEIWMWGIIRGGGMNRVSLSCVWVKCVSKMCL